MPRTAVEFEALILACAKHTYNVMESAGFDDRPRDKDAQAAILGGVALALGSVVLASVKNDPAKFATLWAQMGAAVAQRVIPNPTPQKSGG